jgi:hypothetical protein
MELGKEKESRCSMLRRLARSCLQGLQHGGAFSSSPAATRSAILELAVSPASLTHRPPAWLIASWSELIACSSTIGRAGGGSEHQWEWKLRLVDRGPQRALL